MSSLTSSGDWHLCLRGRGISLGGRMQEEGKERKERRRFKLAWRG